MSVTLLIIILASSVCVVRASFEQSNEGSEFYVGFIHNRFGIHNEVEKIPPVLWITTKETTQVEFTVATINGVIFSGIARPQQITYVAVSTGMIVSDSTPSECFKGIHIKTKNSKKIVVFGQNEEEASNDAYLALPVVTLPEGRSYEYIVASIKGDSGTDEGSVALIIGTENNTKIFIKPSVTILSHFAPLQRFFPFAPDIFNTITIQRFQTVYLQVRGGDISGTHITSNKPISVFSGHECADVPLSSEPCDMLIEQIPPIDTWGSEVVTIPLKTKEGDIIKVIASQDATRVNVTHTNIDDGTITKHDTFSLNAGQFEELLIKDFSLIESDNPIAVFQFARSVLADRVITSDPLMLLVPPHEQYCNSYAVATAPFEPSLTASLAGRVAYVNYTNIAVPAEFFNLSSLIVNNKTANASEYKPIRRADKSIWGYGAQLLLDEGAQVIKHQDPNAVLSVTMYGFSNQQSWGCTGGMGLAPVAVPRITTSNMMVFENDGTAVVEITRSGPLNSDVSVNVTTVDGTALAGIDYTAVSQIVRFKSGQSLANINIPIKDDNVYEEPNITIRIIIVPNKDIIVLSGDSVVTIVDDDHSVQVKFSQPLYSTLESSGKLHGALISSKPLQNIYQIKLRLISGNATKYKDFAGRSIYIKFFPGKTVANFTIRIFKDRVFEGIECFAIQLVRHSFARQHNVKIGNPNRAIGKIIDEVPKINIRNVTVFENDGMASIHVERSEGLNMKFMMNVTTVGGTAIAGKDYTAVLKIITFLSHQSAVIVNIPILDDIIPQEPDIYFFVEIIFNSNTIARSIITIADNDHYTVVEFSSSSYIGSESLKGVPITVLITQGTISPEENIAINVVATSHSPVSAEGYNKDFSSLSVPVTFTNRTTKVSSIIPVFQDKIIEDIETFDLNIDIPSDLKNRISPGRQRKAIASIIDSTIINCPANFKVIAMQKSNTNKIVRKEVRSAIKNVLDTAENIRTDKDAFTKIAASLEVESTTEKFVQFQNAINEISEASYEACHGSDSNLVLPEETQALIDKFEKAVQDKKSTEARHSFGKLLCLRQKFQTNNTVVVKRQTDTYGEALKEWFKDLSVTDFPILFFEEVASEIPTLAFVVDDTGSMSDEINAVKDIIKAIIKAEKNNTNYILGTFNDPEVGEAKYYDSYKLDKLNELKKDVEAITPHGGGDCPELGMEGILRALGLSTDDSHVIVLTDAGCLDCEKKDTVIRVAKSLRTKVHFFFSRTGCGDDFPHYRDVQDATGGVSVNTIESFNSLTLFITELRSEGSKRSVHSKDSYLSLSYKCKILKISVFAIKFELFVNQNSRFTKIYDPLGYSFTSQHISDEVSGYISSGKPRNGSWRICSVNETYKFTVTKKEILDFSVDYYQDGHYSSAIPMAGNVSILSVFTTQLDNILVDNNLTLSFISKDNKFVGSTPLLLCNGYLLGRIVIPSVNFVYRLSGNDKFGNPFVYTKRSLRNTPRKPYFLENVLDGNGNKTINTGSKESIYFSLKSTNAATSPLSFDIVASTSPSELMLRYQATVTVKPNDAEIIVVVIETKDTDMPGSYVVKVTASSKDLILTSSQPITLVKPDESSCPCLNGGTCRYSSRGGRTFIHCTCPTGYFGSKCQIEI